MQTKSQKPRKKCSAVPRIRHEYQYVSSKKKNFKKYRGNAQDVFHFISSSFHFFIFLLNSEVLNPQAQNLLKLVKILLIKLRHEWELPLPTFVIDMIKLHIPTCLFKLSVEKKNECESSHSPWHQEPHICKTTNLFKHNH